MSVAVILAGGKSRRMGRDKLTLELDGQTLLQSAVNRFATEFETVCVSVADLSKYPEVQAPRIADIYQGAGPLSGLHAVLKQFPAVFLVAADLPYSCPRMAKRVAELCGEHEACAIRLPDGRLEPLFGFYRNSILGRCEDAIKSRDYRMTEILRNSNTRYVSPDELGDLWDEKLLTNINYPQDYLEIKRVP